MFNPASWFGSDDSGDPGPSSAIEPTSTYAVALGGVAGGRDELVIYDDNGSVRDFSGSSLTFELDNNNVELSPRDGYADYMSGSGAKIVPKKVGTTNITYFVDGVSSPDKFKVIVPPQILIMILMGEARGEIEAEAQVDGDIVLLDSSSPTANAIGAVVRNRLLLTDIYGDFNLFVVDKTEWNADPPTSNWEAVINAESGGVYQFSPVDPLSFSNDIFTASALREALIGESEFIAYDQSVLSAAGIFANTTDDPTGGAFAFRSPTANQSVCLAGALLTRTTVLPSDCGPGDENFPAFAPVQILIHPSVSLTDDGRPSFVFYRNRSEDEPAVTNAP